MNHLSVIIPCHNELLRIPGTLEMFSSQTRPPDELIIVDDCSTDGSQELLLLSVRVSCPFLKVLRTPKNLGPAEAVKIGFSASTGSHVFFGAMDDAIAPNFIETMMQHVDERAGLLFCDVKEGCGAIVHRFEPGYSDPIQTASQMQGQHIMGCGSIWRRDTLEASGIFDPALRWHCDWFASQVVALSHGVVYLPQVLAETVYRPDSFSNRGRHDWAKQGPILEHILALMNAPEFYHLLPAFIWAKSMNHFPEAARLLVEKPYLMTGTNRLLLRDALAQMLVG